MESLDVGCGFSRQHLRRGEIAIDLEKGLCDIQASVFYLPFRASVFDKILASHLVEHLDNLGLAFDEIKRVLKPQGILEVWTPNSSALWRFKDSILKREPTSCKEHIYIFGEPELRNLLNMQGFDILSIEYSGTQWHTCNLFYKMLFWLFPALRHNLHVCSKKRGIVETIPSR